jgi:hypothetical protein
MTTQNKWIIAACAILLVIAASSTAYYFKHRGGPDPAKMSAEQIQTYMQSPDFNNMPREQRREFFGKVMDSRVEGYFNTPVADRDKYLDKIIDDMQNFRPRNFDPQRVRDPNRIQQMQQRFNNRSPEQSRARREMRDPVQDAKRREFFMALGARAQARGIQMGGFGGGRGGPRQ